MAVARVDEKHEIVVIYYDEFEEDMRRYFDSPIGKNPAYKDYLLAPIKTFERYHIEKIIREVDKEKKSKKKKFDY